MHLLNIVAPVFFLIVVGVLARRRLRLEPGPFARLSLFVFSPALSFHSILTAELKPGEVGSILVFGLLFSAAMVVLTWLASRLLGLDRTAESSLMLAANFPNIGNYGLPVVMFALGQAGFDRAIIFVVYMGMTVASLGVFFAARGAVGAEVAAAGGPVRPLWRLALERSLRMPLLHAAVAGAVLRTAGVQLPAMVMRPLELMAAATVPLLVVILGLQIGTTLEEMARRWRSGHGALGPGWAGRIAVATAMRLLLSPAVAWGLAALLPLAPVARQALVIQAAMPVAANITLLALEFGAEPDLTALTTVISTGLSLLTLTGLLALML